MFCGLRLERERNKKRIQNNSPKTQGKSSVGLYSSRWHDMIKTYVYRNKVREYGMNWINLAKNSYQRGVILKTVKV
jgi:hypothetical protein